MLASEGCSFDVASPQEVAAVRTLGTAPGTTYSNPARSVHATAAALAAGVRRFCFDSAGELRRLALAAPGSDVSVRLAASPTKSVIRSEGKFGVTPELAVGLMLEARALGLNPYGISFHVGSQMLDLQAWAEPVVRCGQIMRVLDRHGIRVETVNIGGGFPATYAAPVPPLRAYGLAVRAALEGLPYAVDVVAEPGRCLVADAGTLHANVLGVVDRRSGTWLHTDVGVFNGMMEVLKTGGRLKYPISDSRHAPAKRRYHLTGPTCDAQDAYAHDVLLSQGLTDGDQVFIESAGAYTTSYATDFNGFPRPDVLVVG